MVKKFTLEFFVNEGNTHKLKMNSQLSRGIRKCASLLEIQQFGCIFSKLAHFGNNLGQFFCWDTMAQL